MQSIPLALAVGQNNSYLIPNSYGMRWDEMNTMLGLVLEISMGRQSNLIRCPVHVVATHPNGCAAR